MNTTWIKLLSFAAMSVYAGISAEKDVRKESFEVKPGGTLEMRVDRGTVKVLTALSDKVDVQVVRELKRGSDEEAQDAFRKHHIDISQDGNVVRIEAENDGAGPFNRKARQLHVEYTVTVPAQFNLDIRTSGGSVDVADIEGTVKLQTSGGNLVLGRIKGDIHGSTSGGRIAVEAGSGSADLQTAGGDIRVGSLAGNLRAKTSGGNIVISDLNGDSDIATTGGNIQLKQVDGAVKARTTGGSIKAQLGGSIKADSSLKTTGGNIDLMLSEKVALDLSAKTTGGSVKSDIEGELNKQRTKLVTQINGGGPELAVETTGGNITVRTK